MTPLPLAGGVGGGQVKSMPEWKPRNTTRARELRNTATPAERKLWEYLSRSQLGAKFSRQMPVGPWYADFLCRELHLIVELDGFSHDVQPEKDVRRDADLQARGHTVLHFRNEEVMEDAEAVARAIQLKIEESALSNQIIKQVRMELEEVLQLLRR